MMTPHHAPFVTRWAAGVTALALWMGPLGPRVALAGDPPAAVQPGAPTAPSEVSVRLDPVTALQGQPVGATDGSTHPVVHVLEKRPDPELGVVKLARYVNTVSARSGDVVHVAVRYEEQCTLPCGIRVDNSERPIFFLIRDGSPISGDFRIPAGADVFTLKYDAGRRGLYKAGLWLSLTVVLFPVGVPMAIVGKPRMWIASGSPQEATDFVRLKKAKK